jgi:hypothetical protein
MAKAHRKDWNPGSASAEVIWAIMAHSDYDPEQHGGAVAEVCLMMFLVLPDDLCIYIDCIFDIRDVP